MFGVLKATFSDFLEDECPRMAAALSYYTIFSLPPLLLLILIATGVFVDPSRVEELLRQEMAGRIGPGGAEQLGTMIRNAARPGGGLSLATILSVAALLFGATGAFGQLQGALNRAWDVEPDPEKGGVRNFLLKRGMSLGMILTVAFLLLVSMILGAVVTASGERIASALPGGVSDAFLAGLELVLSLVVATGVFAALFKVLPDAKLTWQDVGTGALVTGVLFVAGEFLIGLYLARSSPGEAYGAAGSLALIMLWVYYSSLILFLGAEFTQAWAAHRGRDILPDDDAVRVVTERRHVRPDGEEGPRTAPTG